MDSGLRVTRKGRKLGSSRRRQMREPADGQDAPVAPEPESWSSQSAEELQRFFQDCGAEERGFVTREDLAAAKFSFLSSEDELEMIFDWVDVERKGRLSLEEFSSGLKNIFGSSSSSHRLHRKRPLLSKRGSVVTSFPVVEEANSEEKEAFFAFMEQLGASNSLPEQAEIWQLWRTLRQEEPQLAGNLEGFLAKMNSRLQEARADKEVLELTLRKRDTDHHREVQQLYEEMEQQIQREKQQLQAESDSRGLALSSQMQEVLEAKEREVQRLTEGQKELEAQIHRLSSTHQEASSENRQLREAEQDLAGRLEEVRGQLQVTRGQLDAARGRVSWQMEEELSVPRAGEEKAPDAQAVSCEEAPLPGLFGDNDDWDQLLSGISSTPLSALQLCWSPPPTPKASPGPPTPREVRQISISEPHAPLFAQEPSSDPGGSPRSPPGVPSGTEEEEGANPDGPDTNPPEQTGEPPSPESREGSGLGPRVHFPWGLPGVPAGESGSLVAAALEVLVPLEDGPPPQVTSPPPQASAGPKAWFQTSHLEPYVPLFAQEPSSDPGGSPRSPPGVPSGTEEEEGVNPDGLDMSPPEQTGEPPSLEPREESELGPGVHFPWGLPGMPAGESGSLVAAALEVLVPLEDGAPPQVTSPPPQASAGPSPRFQTSHLEPHVPLFAQEPSSDPGGSPRSPPGAPSGTEEEEGVNPDGLDMSPSEQTGEPPSPESREESGLGPGAHISWGLPGVPAGESGSLVAAALEVLVPLEDGAPPQVTSPPPQASAGPSPRFQTSHLEPHAPLFAQEPSSDPGGSPRSPPGAPSGTEEEEGVNPDGLDTSPPEQTGQPPSLEPREESELDPGAHISWGLPGVPAGESGSLVAAALEVLVPLEDGPPPQVTSPPPQASAGPKAWFQTSHLEPYVPLFAQEPSSDPGGSPRSPPGVPSGTEEEEGVNPDGLDMSPPEQTGEPPSLEPREESELGPGVHFPWGLPGMPAGESGSLVAAALEVLVPLEDGAPPQVTSPPPQASAGPSPRFQTSHLEPHVPLFAQEPSSDPGGSPRSPPGAPSGTEEEEGVNPDGLDMSPSEQTGEPPSPESREESGLGPGAHISWGLPGVPAGESGSLVAAALEVLVPLEDGAPPQVTSPPPQASAGPSPRFQTSHLEPHAPLFAQEPSSDPGGSPRSPPGAPSGTEEEEGVNPDGLDTSPPEQTGQPPSLEPREESELDPGAHISWGLPGVPAGESGSLVAAALEVLVPLEDGPPPQVTSPPPQASAGPKAWFQTSHLEPYVPLFAQEPSSDPGGSPRSPPGVPSGTEEEEGVNPDGLDMSPPEQTGEPPSLEPREESELGPGVHFPWGLPGMPAGESGSLVAAALEVLVPLEDGAPPQVTSPPPQASAGPSPRFQTSHLEPHVPLFAQEPSSDPGGSPRSPPGAPSGTEEEEGVNPDGLDMSPSEQTGEPPSPESREESGLGPGAHISWGLPGVPAGESGSLVAAALEVLVPLEDGAPPQVTSPPPQASAGPSPRFQTSHLEPHAPLFAQEPSSDPGGSPRSPPGAPSGTEEEEGVNPDGLDTSPPEQTGQPPSLEPREESELDPGAHISWGLPGVPAGESGSLVAAALEVLVPLEDGPPPQVTSPPPQASAGPKAWFQTSHLEPYVPLFAQEPSSDPGGSPRSPPGVPSGTEEEEGVNPDGLDMSPPEQTGEPPSLEPREESELGPGVHFPWGLPGMPAGESGSLVAAALEVLVPLEDGAPPQVTSPPPQASAGPSPRFQTSHLEPHVPLFAQEPSSDPGGSPRSPPGAPSGTEEEEGVNPDGLDMSPSEQTGEPPSPESREESGLGPGAHISWGLPGVPAGESGSLVAAALEVLVPLEDGAPPQVTSPPPQASAGPSPRFQTSHLEPHAPLFAQEPSSDPGGSPRSPPGAPSGTEEEEGVNPDGLDTSPPEQTGQPPSLEPREESELDPGAHISWGLPGVPAGESGSLVAAALEVLVPLEDGPPPQVTSPPPQASAGPKAWFQTSHLEPYVPLFAQEPSSDPGGSPRSPPGVPSGTEEEEGVNPDGLDMSPPEQTGEPPSLEPREESELGPGVHFPWGLPGMPAGESGSLVAAALEVLVPLEDGAPSSSDLAPSPGLSWAQPTEPSSDPGGSPRSPPGAPSGTEEEEGVNPDGLDMSPSEQTGEPPSPESREESGLGPGAHISWGLPGVPAGESGSLVAAALEVLVPLEDGAPPQVTSPPPQASAGPSPRFQTSHLEPHAPLFAQEPSSDPGGSPRSPPGAPSGTEEEEGVNPDGLDMSPPEQTGEPPSLEPREESELDPGAHISWGLPGVPAGESGSLVAAALEVLVPLEDGPPPQVTSPSPQASAGPSPRFQTSHLEPHVPLFAQEPSSDPGGSPRSPPGVPSGTEEEEGVNPDGLDMSPPEQTGEPPSLEPREESELGPGVHFPWGLPGMPAGESGSLVAAALEVLVPLEDGAPPQVTSPPPQASAGPSPRFQTSHLEPHAPLFAQEPSSDPGGSPRSPPGAPSGTEEEEGVNPDGLDTSPPEQTGEPPSPESREESELGPGAHISWGLPGVPAGESGSLVAAALEVLVPLEDGPPPQVTSPSPQASAGPSPRFQTSHLEPHVPLFAQEPSSDPGGSPRSPPGVPSGTEEEEGVNPDGLDTSPPEQTGEPPSPESREESELGPGAHISWGLPGVLAGESGSLVAAALEVLVPLEDGPPPQVTSPPPQASVGPSAWFQTSHPDDEGPDPGPVPPKPPRQREALLWDPHSAGSEPRPVSSGTGALPVGLGEPSQGLVPGGSAPMDGSEQGKRSPDAQEGHSGELREAHGRVPGPPAFLPRSLEEEPGAEERKAEEQGGQQFRSELTIEVRGLKPEHSELAQLDSQPVPGPPDRMQAEAEAEAPAPRKPSSGFARIGAEPGDGAGPPEPTQTLPTRAELEAQPRPRPTTTHAEGEQAPSKSREPRAENRPEDPRTDSGGPGLTLSPGDRAASEPLANPDYAFHVIFLGDANVGKTSFLHLLHQNSFATGLTATVGVDFRVKNLLVDNKRFALQLWDTAGQERYHSVTRQLLRKADGVVLMYDITSQESFVHVRYWLDCLQDAESDDVVILLLGNKTDREEDRQVSTEAGQQLAQELGVSFGECSAALGHNILEPMVHLARSLKMQEERLKGSLVEVAPEKPPKRAGCCS
ncbi:ras-related protein Rab-44 [Odocoileus virginianus]|uniref:Ras-related protein Rab-44 n=1 Tax=Odocoileus virginianus TaxID=9874 RepID=A0ABM4HBR3_ODOVR